MNTQALKILFALSGNVASRSLNESNAAESGDNPLFRQIFTRMFNELDSDTGQTTEATELADLLSPGTLKLLREKLTGATSPKTEKSNLLNKLLESEDSEELLQQLAQLIPPETLSHLESTDQLIAKLDNLQAASPGTEDAVNKLKALLDSNRQKVNEFLESLKASRLSGKKNTTANTSTEAGLVSGKSIKDKFFENRPAAKSAPANPRNTAETASKPSFELTSENLKENFGPPPQSKNNIKRPVISRKGDGLKQPVSENSAKKPLAQASLKPETTANTRNTNNNNLTNKAFPGRTSIENIKQSGKSSDTELDFTDIQTSQLYEISRSQKAQPDIAKQIDFTGKRVDIGRQVQESFRTAAEEGVKQVKVNLNPPELGKIVIRLRQQGGELTGKLEVNNPQTKVEIDKAIAGVINTLKNSGLTIQKPEIVLTDNSSNSNYQQGLKGEEFTDSRFAGQQDESSDRDFEEKGSEQTARNTEPGLASPEPAAAENTDNKAGTGAAGLDFFV